MRQITHRSSNPGTIRRIKSRELVRRRKITTSDNARIIARAIAPILHKQGQDVLATQAYIEGGKIKPNVFKVKQLLNLVDTETQTND